ncbi:uncharacterized protein LOC108701721 [Xenopus laevis]|uniref:Uncharacterized protein LOC108701721 n=2 Tax=Xenopus laevis TaxID=8355 RepID=A0A1L8EZ10_XENLA|nr:uncharacterized protein LOC108701721 [Xenopus laevis]OCT64550.1 hypothetical protein XELAEV_18045649mg [Xenopus laevis]
MKLLLALLVVFMAVLLEGTKPTQGLECYDCNIRTCKKKLSAPCESAEDTCIKISRKIVGYDGSPDRENEFDPTMNVLVWERRCTTAADCKKRQSDTRLGKITSCCNKNLCNA